MPGPERNPAETFELTENAIRKIHAICGIFASFIHALPDWGAQKPLIAAELTAAMLINDSIYDLSAELNRTLAENAEDLIAEVSRLTLNLKRGASRPD